MSRVTSFNNEMYATKQEERNTKQRKNKKLTSLLGR